MSYDLDRIQVAELLSTSTRTIDRHIRSGRIRTRRVGKKVLLHREDVDRLRFSDVSVETVEYPQSIQDTVVPNRVWQVLAETPAVGLQIRELGEIVMNLKGILQDKDERLKTVAYRLGEAETRLKDSLPLVEHTKAMYLVKASDDKKTEVIHSLQYREKTLQHQVSDLRKILTAMAILSAILFALAAVFLAL